MVNWVEKAQSKLLRRVATNAGLRQISVDVDGAGTVINLWAPRKKVDGEDSRRNHPVVLLHGFAGDGIMTWALQVSALAKENRYDVYIPDLLQFGGSTTPSPDRSVAFQACCIAAALRKVGVDEPCTVVGFSYGGFVAFEMAARQEATGLQVRSVVVSGAAVAHTDTTKGALAAMLRRFSVGSLAELLLPETVRRLRSLLSAALYTKVWFPGCLMKDFLEVMYSNRKERAELLENLVMKDDEQAAASIAQHVFRQINILLLWGEKDSFFTIEDAKRLKQELLLLQVHGAAPGESTRSRKVKVTVTLRSISKAGHLAHLDRPCVYNRCLIDFLHAMPAN